MIPHGRSENFRETFGTIEGFKFVGLSLRTWIQDFGDSKDVDA